MKRDHRKREWLDELTGIEPSTVYEGAYSTHYAVLLFSEHTEYDADPEAERRRQQSRARRKRAGEGLTHRMATPSGTIPYTASFAADHCLPLAARTDGAFPSRDHLISEHLPGRQKVLVVEPGQRTRCWSCQAGCRQLSTRAHTTTRIYY